MRYTRDDTRQAIERRIAQYVTGKSGWLSGFEDFAREQNLLPVLVDLHTFFFVSPDGDVYVGDVFDEPMSLVKDDRWARRMGTFALAQKRFPELAAFIPEREATDPDCPSCLGTGKWSYQGTPILDVNVICPECGSLGWVVGGTKRDG